jgi:hypothetical protein
MNWNNRIVGQGMEAPDQLLAHPGNWRIHPKHQQDALKGVLDDVGWVQNILVNKTTGHVVDGHLRVALALRHDVPEVPVVYVELSEEEESLILATLDPLSALAAADAQKLDDLLRDVQSDDAAIQTMLSDLAAANDLYLDDEPTPDPGAQIDKAEELQQKWNVQRGDLWQIGDHRLLCGDSTSAEDVARVMGGEKADAVVTDPPYGIGATTMTLGNGKKEFYRGEWDKKRPDITSCLEMAKEIVIWGGNYFADILPITNDWLCWHKKISGVSFSEFELAWSNLGCNCRILDHHWSGEEKEHPTQKPLPVMVWTVGLTKGDLVFDPFIGSGTTLVACEQTGRRGRGIEIEPKYCAVALQRLQDMGLEPARER